MSGVTRASLGLFNAITLVIRPWLELNLRTMGLVYRTKTFTALPSCAFAFRCWRPNVRTGRQADGINRLWGRRPSLYGGPAQEISRPNGYY